MSTQPQTKVRHALLTTVALLGMGLPLSGLLPGNAAMAHSMLGQTASRHHHPQPPVMTPPLPTSTPQPAKPKIPTYLESYGFNYQYANKPIINGGPTPQSYFGTGFAPVGTYKPGQTINITDTFGRSIGTYTIGSVNDQVPYDAQKLNQVTIVEYDYDLAMAPLVTRVTAGTGLGTSGGSNGLGSERGTLVGRGAFGTDVIFNNQQTAINPIHF